MQKKFNPIGRCVDEAERVWKALKDIYGEETIKHRTVTCEKHFLWSIENLKSTLQKTSKRVAIYESLAYELMKLETPNKYDALLNEFISSIKGNQHKGRSWEDLLNSGLREDIILVQRSKTAMH